MKKLSLSVSLFQKYPPIIEAPFIRLKSETINAATIIPTINERFIRLVINAMIRTIIGGVSTSQEFVMIIPLGKMNHYLF